MVTAAEALPGRDERMVVPDRHEVLGTPLEPPFPDGLEQAVVGMGCFWGAERLFWQLPGVYTTRGRLRRRVHAQPDLPGDVQRPHRPHRGGARRLRSRRRSPTRRSCGRSGRATTRPRATARATTSGRSTARRCTGRRPRSATPRSPPATRTPARLAEAGYGEITTELGDGAASSSTPSRTTSSTSQRTRTGTAGSAARASPAPSASRLTG